MTMPLDDWAPEEREALLRAGLLQNIADDDVAAEQRDGAAL